MAKNLNQCSFIGRIGGDIETQFMPSGTQKCSFSIAVNDQYLDRDGNKQETCEWISLVAFGKIAEVIAQYMHKGSKVYVSGKFTNNEWEYEGKKHYRVEVLIRTIEFLDGANQGTQRQPENRNNEPRANQRNSRGGDSTSGSRSTNRPDGNYGRNRGGGGDYSQSKNRNQSQDHTDFDDEIPF